MRQMLLRPIGLVQCQRRILLACALLLPILGATGFGPPVLTDGRHDGLRLYPEHVQSLWRLSHPPAVTAVSALMVDLDSGLELFALRPHDRLPPASTVKLMTALVVLQHSSVEDWATVSAGAASMSGSRMGLVAGERLTVGELLYGLLLPSGNDAAVALAEHIGGSQAAFVAMMNDAAAALGLGETHFTNPHGLDEPTQTASAADLARLARAALAYPIFGKIVGTDAAFLAGRSLTNTNLLLGSYRGADGIKTGTTAAAGECLVASVSRRGHRLLVVLLGSSDRYADAQALLDYAASGWQWQPAALPEDALAWEIGPDGRTYRLRTEDPPELFLAAWQWRLIQPLRELSAGVPLTSTVPVGVLEMVLGGQTMAAVPLSVWQEP